MLRPHQSGVQVGTPPLGLVPSSFRALCCPLRRGRGGRGTCVCVYSFVAYPSLRGPGAGDPVLQGPPLPAAGGGTPPPWWAAPSPCSCNPEVPLPPFLPSLCACVCVCLCATCVRGACAGVNKDPFHGSGSLFGLARGKVGIGCFCCGCPKRRGGLCLTWRDPPSRSAGSPHPSQRRRVNSPCGEKGGGLLGLGPCPPPSPPSSTYDVSPEFRLLPSEKSLYVNFCPALQLGSPRSSSPSLRLLNEPQGC